MKTMILYFKLLLAFGLMAIFFQGCYTQFVPTRDEDLSYRQEQQSAVQNDSSYYGEDNDNWQSHQCLGFSIIIRLEFILVMGLWMCVPSYWDQWYWVLHSILVLPIILINGLLDLIQDMAMDIHIILVRLRRAISLSEK